MLKITVPLYIIKKYKTKKSKNIYINLNNYRNQNRFLEHDVKVKYQNIVIDKLGDAIIKESVYLYYNLIVGDKRLKDTNNITCIADKYVSDALVEGGYIKDDNYTIIKGTYSGYGGYDKGNARLDVYICNSIEELIKQIMELQLDIK